MSRSSNLLLAAALAVGTGPTYSGAASARDDKVGCAKSDAPTAPARSSTTRDEARIFDRRQETPRQLRSTEGSGAGANPAAAENLVRLPIRRRRRRAPAPRSARRSQEFLRPACAESARRRPADSPSWLSSRRGEANTQGDVWPPILIGRPAGNCVATDNESGRERHWPAAWRWRSGARDNRDRLPTRPRIGRGHADKPRRSGRSGKWPTDRRKRERKGAHK